MRLTVDLDLRQVIAGPGVRQAVASLYLTRGDALDLEIQFVQNNVVVDPTPDSLFFCVKPAGVHDGDPLVLATDFVKSGSGTTAYWTCQPNLATTPLDAALGLGGGTDVSSLTATAEIGFITSGRQTTTRALRCVIENDLFRGSESTPNAYPTGTTLTFYRTITALTGGANALDGIPTSGLGVGVLVQILVGGLLQTWQLQAGTTAEDVGAGVVRPDDYAASTNEKVWVRLTTGASGDAILLPAAWADVVDGESYVVFGGGRAATAIRTAVLVHNLGVENFTLTSSGTGGPIVIAPGESVQFSSVPQGGLYGLEVLERKTPALLDNGELVGPIIPQMLLESDTTTIPGLRHLFARVDSLTAPTSVKLGLGDGVNTAGVLAAGGGGGIAFGVTPPSDPSEYPFWWSSELGQLFVYYSDGTSSQWVIANAGSGSGGGGSTSWGDLTGIPAAVVGTTASFTTALESKLAGIATGATANSPDATLLSRANHTGTQAISTVTGLQTALDSKAADTHSHSAADISAGTFDPARLPVSTTDTPGAVRLAGAFAATVSTADNTNLALLATQPNEVATITAGAGAGGYIHTVTLQSTNAHAGAFITVNVDLAASTNPRIELRNLTSGGTLIDEAIGNGTARRVIFRCVFDGTDWSLVSRMPMEESFIFRRDTGGPAGSTGALPGPFTWVLPIRARSMRCELLSGGSGGGSGRRGAAGTTRGGGGGGSGGNGLDFEVPASTFGGGGATITATIGAGGLGGAAPGSDNTDGNFGTHGGDTSISGGGTLMLAPGALYPSGNGRGRPGTTSGGAQSTRGGYGNRPGTQGGAGSVSSAAGSIGLSTDFEIPGGGGGAGGGGIDASNNHYAGGGVSSPSTAAFVTNSTWTATVGAAGGGDGVTATYGGPFVLWGTFSSSGGGGNNAGGGGQGGDGYFPGCGGSGAGASTNGTTGKRGGNGADGILRLTIRY